MRVVLKCFSWEGFTVLARSNCANIMMGRIVWTTGNPEKIHLKEINFVGELKLPGKG